MRGRFRIAHQDIHRGGSSPNFEWKYKDLCLNDSQVQDVAQIVGYGLGSKWMGKAETNVDNGYKYTPGERPW
eukprot:7764765-Karenia_brevis.AAC.1